MRSFQVPLETDALPLGAFRQDYHRGKSGAAKMHAYYEDLAWCVRNRWPVDGTAR